MTQPVRPMGKRRAKRAACIVVSNLIESYFDVGQPHEDCADHHRGWAPPDGDVLYAALAEIRDEMDRRSGVCP